MRAGLEEVRNICIQEAGPVAPSSLALAKATSASVLLPRVTKAMFYTEVA